MVSNIPRWQHKSKLEAAALLRQQADDAQDEQDRQALLKLRQWILEAHHFREGIYQMRVAAADAERALEAAQ